jgi:DnaJ-class molecular chaperone
MPDTQPIRKRRTLSVDTIVQSRRELGLFDTATQEEIDNTYHRLAAQFHPDRCPDAQKADCARRFQQISAAHQLLLDVLRRYRYSLRPDDVRRDQEDAELKHLRQFGQGLWSGDDPLPPKMTHGTPLRGEMRVTAENVAWAREVLGLGESITAQQLTRRYRQLAVRHHPDRHNTEDRSRASREFDHIERAYRLLTTLLDNYSYSFRPDDLRRDQKHILTGRQN